jgi:hypothetical protein
MTCSAGQEANRLANEESAMRTEDDGYTYPPNATEAEKAEIDKQELQARGGRWQARRTTFSQCNYSDGEGNGAEAHQWLVMELLHLLFLYLRISKSM